MKINLLVTFFYFFFISFLFKELFFFSGIISGGDWLFPMGFGQTQAYFLRNLFTWAENDLLGAPQFFLSDLFFRLIVYLLGIIGLSGGIIPSMFLFLIFFLSGFFMYLFCKFLGCSRKTSFLGGLLYITLPFFFNYASMGWQFVLLSMGILPFALILFIKSVQEERFFYSVLVGFLYFLAAFQSQAVFWYPLTFFSFAFFLINNKKSFAVYLKSIFIIFFVFLGISAFWWAPPLFSGGSGLFTTRFGLSPTSLGTWTRLSYLNILRLWGSLFNYQYETSYPQILVPLSFLLPVLSFLSIIFFPKKKLIISLVFIALVTPILFSFGPHFISRLPFSDVFRDMGRFLVLPSFSFVVLTTLFLNFLFKQKKKAFRFAGGFLVVLLFLNAYPFWGGELFEEQKKQHDIRLRAYSFPSEYFSLESYLEKQKEGVKVLYLPIGGVLKPNDNKNFLGEYRGIVDIFAIFSPKRGGWAISDRDLDNPGSIIGLKIAEETKRGEGKFLEKMLPLIGAKYVAVRNNVLFGEKSGEEITSTLKSLQNLSLVMDWNKVSLFENNNFLPHFYIPQNIIYSTGGIESLVDVVGFEDYKIRSGIYLTKTGELKEETASKLRSRADKIFIKTNLENSIGDNFFEKTRKRDNFKIGVPFPHVRHQPGSLAYRLALAREWLEEWRVRNNQEELIEKKLFYAGKRISELESWGEEKRVQGITLRAYRLKMEEALEEAKQLPKAEKRTEMMIKIGAYWEAHQERVEKIFINKQGRETTADEWRKMFAELAEKIDPLGSGDLKNLEYSFEVPKSGIYSLFIQDISQLTGLEILTEGREIQIEEGRLVANEGWTEIGREEFNQGKNKLTLRLPESANLVGPDWQTRKELEKAEEGVGFFPQEFFPGAENLVFQEINDWQADSFYYLTFEYKIEKGSLGVGVLEERRKEAEEGTKITKIFTKNLKNQGSTEEWKKFEGFLTADKNALEAKIYFYSQADLDQLAEVEFRNLQVRKVVRPKIMLRAKTENINQEEQAMPRITFTKINPTKYRVRVEGAKEPYTLIFSESFHRGWRAYINKTENLRGTTQNQEEIVASYFDGEIKEGVHRNIFLEKATFETWGKDPLPQERHLLVNGYANSWYITPEDSGGRENYEVIIEFQPQRLFYLGLFISIFVFIGCIIYLIYDKFRNKLNA